MIIFVNTKGITKVAMPNLKCSLIYEVQIYKKNNSVLKQDGENGIVTHMK